MRPARSLRFRLFAFATIVVAAALLVTGFSLSALFSRHLERRVGQELDTHLGQLIGGLRIDAAGLGLTHEPVDPRFQTVFGGLYWQVSDAATGKLLRSRSLWDVTLDMQGDQPAPGQTRIHDQPGPQDATLLVHETMVILNAADGDHRLRVLVGIDRGDLSALATGFSRDLAPVLAILGLVLLVGFMLQIGEGLKPAHNVLAGVNAIRSGASRRLSAHGVPREVAPLVEEVNALLDAQDQAIARARDRAANLAHGLKTPLTALATDVERLRARGESGIADEIAELAERMRRHMERELARARLRHGRPVVQVNLKSHAEAVLRALKRTPPGERLNLECSIDEPLGVCVDPDDLNELLGNLAENAVRHAGSLVRIEAERTSGETVIRISDDGPGLNPDRPAAAATGPQRLDQAGAGLGLAIAGDIVDSIDGRLDLERSPLGGLEARITIPLRRKAARPPAR